MSAHTNIFFFDDFLEDARARREEEREAEESLRRVKNRARRREYRARRGLPTPGPRTVDLKN
jgi:hypothetical protein